MSNELTNPGIGIAGTVLSPFGLGRNPCMKGACELWTELTIDNTQQKVGRCALAWLPILTIENRLELTKLSVPVVYKEKENVNL